jgi:3-mercaptopyruvate sulfurtransferase SseA
MVRVITRPELQDLLRRHPRLVLIEVALREDYLRAHIPGAIQHSEAEICEEFPQTHPDHDLEIVLYGNNPLSFGARRAARLLEALGYRRLYFYSGGKDEWVTQGHKIQSYSAAIERGPEPRN